MDSAAETLADEEIVLRRWRVADAGEVHRVVTESLDHLRPWMPWAIDGYSEQAAAEYLRTCRTHWDSGEAFNYAVTKGREIIGSCGLMARIGEGGLEIGYWLAKSWTGRGLATRAAALLTTEGLRIADYTEIHHDQANIRSGAIPARLGYTRLGTRPSTKPGGTAGTGTQVVWRLNRL